MKNITFSTLLDDIIQDQNMSLTDLYNELNDLEMKITYASLYAYYSQNVIPPFDTAKKILKTENYEITDEELQEVLDYSRLIMKEDQVDINNIWKLQLRIKPETVDKKYQNNASKLKFDVEMRAGELFTSDNLITEFSAIGKKRMSAYIAYLISKDLKENGYF